MHSIDYDYEDDNKGFRIECTVDANIVHPFPGDHLNPPTGGYLEDVTFYINKFFLTVRGEEFDVSSSLTDKFKDALADELDNQFHTYDHIQNELYEKFMG